MPDRSVRGEGSVRNEPGKFVGLPRDALACPSGWSNNSQPGALGDAVFPPHGVIRPFNPLIRHIAVLNS